MRILTHSWLTPLLAPLKPIFREVLAVSLFTNILALGVPIFIQQVYDRVVFHAGLSTLQGLVAGIVLLLAFDFVLRQARARMMQSVALRIDVAVSEMLFAKMMSLPLRSLESRPAGFWQALFRDIDTVRNCLSGGSAVLMADLPFVVLFLAVIFIIAPPLALVYLAIMPAFLVMAWRSGRDLARLSESERGRQGSRDALIAEMIAARTTIKALALDHALRPQWGARQAATIEQAMQRGARSDGYVNLGQGLTMLTTVGLTTVGALHIIATEMTMGALIAANMLTSRLLGPLNQLVASWRAFAAFRQSVERLGGVFAEASERQSSAIALECPRGEILAEALTFRFDDRAAPAVDISRLAIPATGMTAIVGPNGSGKTTLLKLLLGLYAPSSGRVLLDGGDIAQFTRGELARWIGYVPQDCVLLEGTIRDNIAHGAPGADDEAILRAAKMAGVHAYIVDLPDGYATRIGEAGAGLSGGQRQRIAIARALVGDPPVLLLDEPSSNLDRQAEEALRGALADLARSHTVVMVSHSPVLLPVCRQIVALNRGKLAACGPAAELLPQLFGPRRPANPAPVPAPQGVPAQ